MIIADINTSHYCGHPRAPAFYCPVTVEVIALHLQIRVIWARVNCGVSHSEKQGLPVFPPMYLCLSSLPSHTLTLQGNTNCLRNKRLLLLRNCVCFGNDTMSFCIWVHSWGFVLGGGGGHPLTVISDFPHCILVLNCYATFNAMEICVALSEKGRGQEGPHKQSGRHFLA